jgi:hypothetical protein
MAGAAAGSPPGFGEALAWWSGGGDREPFFEVAPDGSGVARPTAAAVRFAELVHTAHDVGDAAQALQDAAMDLMPRAEDAGVFVAAARKASPVAALFHGLGAQDSALLPGWFGDFLPTGDEVAAVLPRAARALGVSGTRRDEILSRVSAWTRAMGDAPVFDAAELLDGPLRVLRHAADRGLAATAFSRWY